MLTNNQKGGIIADLIKFIIAACAVVFFVLFIKNPGRFLTPCGQYLIQNEIPQPSDAIVILLGSDPARLGAAYKLYQANLAPKLFFGTGYLNKEALQSLPPGFKWPAPLRLTSFR